jgi:hypothetical protein
MSAGELRISSIARHMDGHYEASYRKVSRFLNKLESAEEFLPRVLLNNAKYTICDPTIIDRPEAIKTEYVGLVRPERRGFYSMVFGAPFKGRILPFYVHTYSPRTIAERSSSRNIEHTNALAGICDIIGDIPVIFDREFSYNGLLKDFEAEGKNYIICLNTSNHVGFTDSNGRKVELSIACGKEKAWSGLYYKGETKVNVAARWTKGFKKPLFVVTSMKNPMEALDLYYQRMKIEQTFKDFKSKIGVGKIMSKKEENMQKLLVIALLAYMLLSIAGETIRDHYFPEQKKNKFSGIFIILNTTNYGLDQPVVKIRKFICSFFKNEIWIFYEKHKSCPNS